MGYSHVPIDVHAHAAIFDPVRLAVDQETRKFLPAAHLMQCVRSSMDAVDVMGNQPNRLKAQFKGFLEALVFTQNKRFYCQVVGVQGMSVRYVWFAKRKFCR